MELISRNNICRTYQRSIELGLINSEDTLVVFLDLAIIKDRVERLKRSFPDSALHAVAIKSNPLSFVLRYLVSLGLGLEAASFGEIKLGQYAGVDSDRLVFDSPAKTEHEIFELGNNGDGIRINADSIAELGRIPIKNSGFRLGIRINPLIQSDGVNYMNVGGEKSKFGEPISNRDAIIEACLKWNDLDCLHLHIGSQYTDFSPTVDSVRTVVSLAEEINSRFAGKIKVIDIGGGFPVNYRSTDEPFQIEIYASALAEKCPKLFDGTYQIITEFGRYVHANAGWAVTKVEYVKPIPGGVNLITHAGADMFLRECYNPGHWHHEMFLMDKTGAEKITGKVQANIAGPLCFGGDFVGFDVTVSEPNKDDCLVVQDVGANTFSLWSRHCSRPFPKVICYRGALGEDMIVAKERETFDSLISFWS